MKLFSKVLESWKDEKAFEKRLADGLAAMEISGYIKQSPLEKNYSPRPVQ